MDPRRFGLETARLAAPDFDLALTLNSGQVFHWREEGAGFAEYVFSLGSRKLVGRDHDPPLLQE